MPSRQLEHIFIRDVKRACIRDGLPLVVVDLLLGKDNYGAKRRTAHEFQQSLHIEAFQVAVKGVRWQTDVPQHERGHRPSPGADAKPAAAFAGPVAHDVYVRINGLQTQFALAFWFQCRCARAASVRMQV